MERCVVSFGRGRNSLSYLLNLILLPLQKPPQIHWIRPPQHSIIQVRYTPDDERNLCRAVCKRGREVGGRTVVKVAQAGVYLRRAEVRIVRVPVRDDIEHGVFAGVAGGRRGGAVGRIEGVIGLTHVRNLRFDAGSVHLFEVAGMPSGLRDRRTVRVAQRREI